jgi:DNA-binding transcriptional regulator LsrR (DeoR family)
MAKKEEVILRRKKVAEMYLQGMQQMQIAEVFGISQQAISKDLKVIYRLWRQSTLTDFNEMKHRELLKIDNLEMTYWNAWNKKNEESKDPKYLQGVQWCISKRMELLGLIEQIKEDYTNTYSIIINSPANFKEFPNNEADVEL